MNTKVNRILIMLLVLGLASLGRMPQSVAGANRTSPNVGQTAPTTLSAASSDPIITTENWWVPNGDVLATAVYSNTLYIGGYFYRISPATGGLAALQASDGTLVSTSPRFAGRIDAIAPDGGGGWFIGGEFSAVNGVPRTSLAHLLSDNTLDPNWDPVVVNGNLASSIFTIAVVNNVVYFGGWFDTVNGQERNRAAAVNADTGELTAWNPNPNGDVRVLTATPTGSGIYAGGSFTLIGGQTRYHLALLNTTTGEPTTWAPNVNGTVYAIAAVNKNIYIGGLFSQVDSQPRSNIASFIIQFTEINLTGWTPNANSAVETILVDSGTAYVGGWFTQIGGQPRKFIAAVNTAGTGNATAWNPDATAYVYALALSDGILYAGGNFSSIGGQSRHKLAALDLTTGQATAWNPEPNGAVDALGISLDEATVYAGGSFTGLGGVERDHLAAYNLTTGQLTDWNPTPNDPVTDLAVSGTTLYAAGSFDEIDEEPRGHLAAFDLTSGGLTDWNPNTDSDVMTILISDTTVYIGGEFNQVGDQVRSLAAAVDSGTGLPIAWNPNITDTGDERVNILALSGNTMYVGGNFTEVGGQARSYLAAVDAGSGALTDWQPDISEADNVGVGALAVYGNTLYAGGDFNTVNGTEHEGIVALDRTTGLPLDWDPNLDVSTVYELLVSGNALYVGGWFTQFAGLERKGLAAMDIPTGEVANWAPILNEEVSDFTFGSPILYIGGNFDWVNYQVTPYLAGLQTLFATTGPASNVTLNSAVITGTVTTNDSTTSAAIQWGSASGTFDQTTPISPIPLGDINTIPVTGTLTGLQYGTTYYYRLSATSAAGTVYGAERSFTTAESGYVYIYLPTVVK